MDSKKGADIPHIGFLGSSLPTGDGHVAELCGVVQHPLWRKEPGTSPPVEPNTTVFRPVPAARVYVHKDGTDRPTETTSDYSMSWESFAVRDHSLIDEIRAAPTACIVTVTISPAMSREEGQHEKLVAECEAFCGPVDRSDWSVLLPESAGGDARSDSAAKEWQEAFDRWAAKKLVESVWRRSTDRWDIHDMASIADGLGRLQDQYHDITLGQPVEFASQLAGLNPVIGTLLKGIVSEHRLPGDTSIKDLKRIGQIIGIGAGAFSGNFYMAHACISSLTKDLATDAISHEIGQLFTQPHDSEPPPDLTRTDKDIALADVPPTDLHKRPLPPRLTTADKDIALADLPPIDLDKRPDQGNRTPGI